MSGLRDTGGSPSIGRALLRVALALALAYAGLGAGLSWWQVVEAQRLTEDPANPLSIAAARSAPRGAILDARGMVLARTVRRGDEQVREYPEPAAGHVVGYKSLLFGTTGVERAFDGQLIGLKALERGQDMLRKFRADPYDPQDVLLSVDLRLQARAMELLGSRRGAVVAIEPSTGRVLALASTPTYDPARVVDADEGRDYFASLRDAEGSPLLNRAIQGRYTPGSVFKIVTAIAGLASGAIERETRFEEQPEAEEDGLPVSGFRVRDGHHEDTGEEALDLVGATEVSCNIWYALAGLATGGDTLVDIAGRMGFGTPIPFELPTAPSYITGEDGTFRDDVEVANAAYGQAETFVTPLQMALVAATVANDGVLMRPTIVRGFRSEDGTERGVSPQQLGRVFDPGDAQSVTDAMVEAVQGDLGREFAGRARIEGVTVAGKSGTAELGGAGEPHSWFIGFAPAAAPRVAVAVVVERGGTGREQAVPMGGRVMEAALRLGE
jgi:penicillin-binding protein A